MSHKRQKAQEEFLKKPIQVSEFFFVLFVPYVPFVAGNKSSVPPVKVLLVFV
jgi:hypothetical protein